MQVVILFLHVGQPFIQVSSNHASQELIRVEKYRNEKILITKVCLTQLLRN